MTKGVRVFSKVLDQQTRVVRISELTVSEMSYVATHNFVMRDFKKRCVHMYRHNKTNSGLNLSKYRSKPDLLTSVEKILKFYQCKVKIFFLNTINHKRFVLGKENTGIGKKVCLQNFRTKKFQMSAKVADEEQGKMNSFPTSVNCHFSNCLSSLFLKKYLFKNLSS